MGYNYGKKFELKFREDWIKSFPDSFIQRLQDNQSGYYGTSSNTCDFITFTNGKLFLIECKSTHGNTLPFSNIRQYDKLLAQRGKPGVSPGILVWWIDKFKIAWVPITSVEKMKNDGKKSINIKMLDEHEYVLFEIPSIKKRVFLDSDYTSILTFGGN